MMMRAATRRAAGAARSARRLPAAAVPVRRMGGGGEERALGEYWAEFKTRTAGLPRSEFSNVAKQMKEQYLADHHGEHHDGEVEMTDENYPVTRNPGGKAGEMATEAEQATGPRFEELSAEQEGELLFSRDPLTGAFGTMDAPVRVPSSFDQRIVGCLGGPGDAEHPLLWFTLYEGRKHACPRCGQVYELVPATGDAAAAAQEKAQQ